MRARTRAVARTWLEGARFEVLPTVGIVDEVSEHLRPGSTVTVTASPANGMAETLRCAEELAGRGFDVVPHLAARMISGRSELEDICARLLAAGVSTVFVPAGDADPAAGAYQDAFELLTDLETLGSPFARVGITGYPESHPHIGDDLTVQAMWDKRRHASQIVSNLVFDPRVVAGWVHRVRARGVHTPILLGLVGPVERARVLRMATKIGVGESTKFLVKNPNLFTRIASPGGYDPMRFLAAVASSAGAPDDNVAGIHLFTFNQVAQAEAWRRAQIEALGAPERAMTR